MSKPQDIFGPSSPKTALNKPMFHVQDQKAYNVNGQTSVINSWTSRDLNTVIINQIPGASLGANSVNLPAGTYYIEGSSLISGNSQGISAIFVGGSRVLQGLMVISCLVNNLNALIIPVSGIITISSASVITLKYLTGVNQSLGLGVNYSNGYMNAITDVTIPSIYSDLKIWQLDTTIQTPVLVSDKLFPLPGNCMVTGNMHGLEYVRNGANQISIYPGICMDSLNTTMLTLSNQQNLNLPTSPNTIFNLFLCNDGVVRYDTDVNGANLTTYKVRWIGFVPNNSSGVLKSFHMIGDCLSFNKATETVIKTGFSGPTAITADHTSFFPVSRIKTIQYGCSCTSGSNGNISTSFDGVTTQQSILANGQNFADASNTFGTIVYGSAVTLFNPGMYFIGYTSDGNQSLLRLLCCSVELKR
jgi:hypothetical protein